MKKLNIIFSLFLVSIVLFGCQQGHEENILQANNKITISPMDNPSEEMVFEDTETIEMIKEAVVQAEKQSGVVNMADPEYKVAIGDETFFLWIDGKSGTIMNIEDSHTIYNLSELSAQQMNEMISVDYMKIKEIAWNYLREQGWNDRAMEEWESAAVSKMIANKDYVLLDKNYEGKEVFKISFEDHANSVVGTPVILVDESTNKVIGYMAGE
ncbi:hypothetical protein [Bacillus sp. AK128]